MTSFSPAPQTPQAEKAIGTPHPVFFPAHPSPVEGGFGIETFREYGSHLVTCTRKGLAEGSRGGSRGHSSPASRTTLPPPTAPESTSLHSTSLHSAPFLPLPSLDSILNSTPYPTRFSPHRPRLKWRNHCSFFARPLDGFTASRSRVESRTINHPTHLARAQHVRILGWFFSRLSRLSTHGGGVESRRRAQGGSEWTLGGFWMGMEARSSNTRASMGSHLSHKKPGLGFDLDLDLEAIALPRGAGVTRLASRCAVEPSRGSWGVQLSRYGRRAYGGDSPAREHARGRSSDGRRGRRYGGRGGRSRRVICIRGAGDTLRLLVYKPRMGRSSPVSRGVPMQITLFFVQSMFAQARASRGAVLYHAGSFVASCTISRLSRHRPPLDARSAPRESSRLPYRLPIPSLETAQPAQLTRLHLRTLFALGSPSPPRKKSMISRRYVSRSASSTRNSSAQYG